MRVLIADDQEMVRTGFRFFLDAQPDMTVIAEAADGEEAVELARRHRPDACLLDIRMPKLDGLRPRRARLVSPSVTVRLLRQLTAPQDPAPPRPATPPPAEPLTDREGEVVRLVALGRTDAEIAAWAWPHGHVQRA
ncbi:response regulator transcription factor [Streptomyces sp. NPDC018693]|uniref:response regulator transcription factor n=1 Tax=unclassified Streptomyces TaxID=2593676 RepID=UPI00378E3BA8